MNAGSFVKNVIFTNATLGTDAGGFISTDCYGTIENVVVYGQIGGTQKDPYSPVAANAMSGSKINNCLVIITAHGNWNGCKVGMITGNRAEGATIANCIGISLKVGNATEQSNAWSPLPCIHVGNLADFSGDDNGVKSLHLWKVDGDHPCAVEGCSSYESWIGTNPDTSIYANGTWHIDETTKKIVVSNETANSLFAAMQA